MFKRITTFVDESENHVFMWLYNSENNSFIFEYTNTYLFTSIYLYAFIYVCSYHYTFFQQRNENHSTSINL